jgi:uncharacterized protein YqeY
MTLKEKIKEDMKTAFKAGDTVTRGTLSMLLSVIQNREIEKRTRGEEPELSDQEVTSAIGTEIKKRKDAASQFESAGRPELAASEKAEAEILMRYMPEQMGEDEVKKLIADAIAGGAADAGQVMRVISPTIKGKFDGARASALAKEALG